MNPDNAAINPAIPEPGTPEGDAPASASQVAELLAILKANGTAPVNTAAAVPELGTLDGAPAAVDPTATTKASETPPPPVGTLVTQTRIMPGGEFEEELFGIVVLVDAEQNAAAVAWFPGQPTTVPGDALTKVG